jgi:hypothetical protein
MNNSEKMFYTINEALEYLHLTLPALSRKIVLYNIEIRKLPASNAEYIATADVKLLEQSIKEPGSIA